MKKGKRNYNIFDSKSLALQQYLDDVAKEVIPTLPNPFGSFEKAKYEIRRAFVRRNKSKYWIPKKPWFFITTSHNTEDALAILKQQAPFFQPHYIIAKTINGIEEILYETPRGKS